MVSIKQKAVIDSIEEGVAVKGSQTVIKEALSSVGNAVEIEEQRNKKAAADVKTVAKITHLLFDANLDNGNSKISVKTAKLVLPLLKNAVKETVQDIEALVERNNKSISELKAAAKVAHILLGVNLDKDVLKPSQVKVANQIVSILKDSAKDLEQRVTDVYKYLDEQKKVLSQSKQATVEKDVEQSRKFGKK